MYFHFYVVEYKGPPDPLRGDEIYRRVRDAAKVRLYESSWNMSFL